MSSTSEGFGYVGLGFGLDRALSWGFVFCVVPFFIPVGGGIGLAWVPKSESKKHHGIAVTSKKEPRIAHDGFFSQQSQARVSCTQ